VRILKQKSVVRQISGAASSSSFSLHVFEIMRCRALLLLHDLKADAFSSPR